MWFDVKTSCSVLTISVEFGILLEVPYCFLSLTFLLPLNLSFIFCQEGVKKDRGRDRHAVRGRGNNKRQKDSENKGGDRREKQICQHTGKVSALLSDWKRWENEKELMSRERERFLGGLWFLFLIIHFTFPLNIPLMWWQTLSLSLSLSLFLSSLSCNNGLWLRGFEL